MDAVEDHEGLDLPEGLAAAAGSFVAMALTALVVQPAAVWIENRTRTGSVRGRRYAPYAAVGMVVGGPLLFVLPIAAPAAVASAVGGRYGVELWRRRDRRHESSPWPVGGGDGGRL